MKDPRTGKATDEGVGVASRPFSVAIIDDDVDLASNLKDILEENGYDVEVCLDASSALQRFSERAFSLGLVDIRLPDMGGLQLVAQLSHSRPGTEYIVITGYGSFDSAVEAVRVPNVIGYEVKPLDLDRLVILVEQIRRRQEADARWRESESRLRLVMERVPCIVWAVDRELRHTYSAGAGLAALGLQAGELVGTTVSGYVEASQENSLSTVSLAHNRALLGVPTTYEIDWQGRTFTCRIEPLTEASGEVVGAVGVAFDITDIAQMHSQLRALTRRLVTAQEEERKRIASELHDQGGQSLTALRIMLDMCMRGASDDVAHALAEARSLVDKLIGEMRDAVVRLHPPMLDDLGLLPTLLWDFDHFRSRTGVSVNFKHAGLRRELDRGLSLTAYRILQECLTNVARHAGVSEAAVVAQADGKMLFLSVEDRGNGFDPSSIGTDCSGLTGMMQRAEMVGGTVEIDTSPGGGTRISVELPLRPPREPTGEVHQD